MENKNIIMLKHHPMNVYFTHPFYRNQCDNLDDYIVIDVTSRASNNKEFMKEHPTFVKDTSPFFMGPVMTEDGLKCNVFEHFWQTSKVYPCHVKDGEVTPEWFKWRQEWFDKETVSKKRNDTRHPNETIGYKPSDCLFSYYYIDGKYQKLGYIDSRKKVYAPTYLKLFYKTETYKWLKSLVNSGKKIALVDFDAYNYYSETAMRGRYESYVKKCKQNHKTPTLSVNDFLNIKTLKDVINCPFMLGGHAFYIKALLQDDLSVNEDGTINDPTGLLK